ncbi:ABC transporter ATP-binding protein [Latilactobacillus curvatus]|uniref:ABC transporter ATP-binding protein n=1 Tax=Latilactobacillus curvatus TaxID=28038 RepID=A0AAJ5RFF9_LATCU|nr:ABC transporter ATP-binding protein [Latilactobacillus curvatus]MCP8847889.1 ABC transporter ATP-binding protein [Latilactobacillus curvatus]MCP8864330.1 ABC transporter ATP-binding protein [Latilactobacillus curvatus]MCP8873125.1 ABC transporter ATP-binding protein [Latilactobacillus curvatus]MCP8874916.1 ABC transporter ATP-binding protein [Latilactobacillus curvatus]MCP8878508.1 ABC transporter ATP-binding protein [Latilactobacillus curvatus]
MIEITKLIKSYYRGSNQNPVLKSINLSISKGEFLSIVGKSGAGKSTLINILGLLDAEFSGQYHFLGLDIRELSDNQLSELRNTSIGFVFQNFKLIENLSVYENIVLPLLYAGKSRSTLRKVVSETLDLVDLPNLESKRPNELSGGQQQRVAIARAIIMDPEIIIADEPTGALDSKTSRDIMNIFKKINDKRKTTIIMVTHDLQLAQQTNRIITISDGAILSDTGRNS